MKFRKWKIILLILGLLIVAFWIFWPKPPEPPKTISSVRELETHINNLINFGSPQGMSLVVVKNGKVIYKNGFVYKGTLEFFLCGFVF